MSERRLLSRPTGERERYARLSGPPYSVYIYTVDSCSLNSEHLGSQLMSLSAMDP